MRTAWMIVACLLTGWLQGQAALAAADPTEKVVWQERFDQGTNHIRTYHKDAPQSALQTGTDADGAPFLRVTLAGQRDLEGVTMSVPGLTGARLTTATARVRGEGRIFLALLSGNGWAYGRPITLSSNWQTVSLSKTLGAADQAASLYFLVSKDQPLRPGTAFDIADVQVRQAEPMAVYDVDVPAWRLEAEDFALRASQIASDREVGQVVQDQGRFTLTGLPFPRTSRPVTVYLRVRPASNTDAFRLVGTRGSVAQVVRSTSAGAAHQWQWVQFDTVLAEEVGHTIRLDAAPDKGAAKPTAIDSIVLSTQNDLPPSTLDAAAPLLPTAPLAAVARISQPPVIDGQPDDACWRETVAIEDFLVFGIMTPASQGTSVRMAYDDANLYILMRAQESVLQSVEQRTSEIIANVTARDGKVLHDDSWMMLLQPNGEGPVYEFTVNTIGTLLDARSEREDLWATRDLTWNASVQLAVERGDGHWTAEMAIPLSDLHVAGIREGDTWRAGLARVAQTRKELSSWNLTEAQGAHRPRNLGVLMFGQPAVGFAPIAPLKRLEPGRNTLGAALTASAADSTGVTMLSMVLSPDGPAWQTSFAHATPQTPRTTHAFDVQATGPVQARWAALDAGTLRPLYVSPQIHTAVQSSSVTLTLSTPGPYRVVVNDQVVTQAGAADAAKIRIPLREGANVIAFEAEAGAAAVSLAAPGLERFPGAWRMNKASTPDATAAKLDDRTWPRVEVGQSMVGQSSEPIVLRRTILWDQTQVWPLPSPALYIAGNTAQHVNFKVEGLAGKQLLDWTTHVAVPKALEVLGSTGYYGNTVKTQPLFQCEPAGEVTIDGQPLRLYQITASKPMLPNRHPTMAVFQLMLRIADPSQAKEGVAWTLHYWSQANDGTVVEAPRSFEVRALPPVAGEQPKRFVVQLWGSAFGAMDSEPLRRATLATAQAAGFNQIVTGDRWTSDTARDFGLTNQATVNFQAWAINLAPHLEAHPDDRLINADGKPSKQFMCTTQLLGERWSVASAILAEQVRQRAPAVVQYDYEFLPLSGPHSCYCKRCLTAFRQHANLPADRPLTPQTIAREHHPAWDDFMAWRVANLFLLMKETVHETAPGTQFSVYSGYQSPYTITHYGVDWRYVGQLKAADIIGVGYGRPTDAIDATYEAVGGIPVILGRLLHPYRLERMIPATLASPAVMLRRSIDATGGVLLYTRNTMDGRSWWGIAEVTRLIAQHEDLFLNRNLEIIPGQDPAKVQVLRGQNVALVCVMNDSDKPADFAFELPAALGAGAAFYRNQTVAAGTAVKLTLPPGGIEAYVLHQP